MLIPIYTVAFNVVFLKEEKKKTIYMLSARITVHTLVTVVYDVQNFLAGIPKEPLKGILKRKNQFRNHQVHCSSI